MNTGSEPNWDGDLFRLYNKRLSAESWQDDFVDDGSSDARGSDSMRGYDRALFGGPGADLFGSSYNTVPEVADQGPADSGPPSVSMPSISRGMPPISQSMPSISQPSISEPMAPISQSMPSISGSMPSISEPMSSISEPMSSISESMSPISQVMPSISGSMPALSAADTPESDELDGGSLVRPYARTRGRTRTDHDLAIETLVSTSERGRTQTTQARPEHRSISELCMEARSVAEVAAHLRLPLGVVRVLIGDMADTGLVLIHDSGMVVGDRPSMEFLERVLSGLRRL